MRGSQISQARFEENKSIDQPEESKKDSPEVKIEKKDGKMRRFGRNKDK